MKISFFIPSLSGGGAERVILNLIQGFSDFEIELTLITVYKDNAWIENLQDICEVIVLDKKHVNQVLFSLIRYLKTKRPDILISAIDNANLINVLACKLSGTKTKSIITIHQISSEFRKLYGNSKEIILDFLTKLVFPYADQMIVVSNYVKQDILKHINVKEERIVAIGNPIIRSGKLEKIRIYHKGTQKGRNIIAVGRFVKEKSYDTLLKAFYIFLQSMDGHLFLYGDGALRDQFVELIMELDIADKVTMPGFVDDVYSKLQEADLCVISSITEGSGNVIVEAMACGVPVVSTDCGGPREILNDGEFGLLVPIQNPDLLAHAMIQTFSTSHDFTKLQTRAMDYSIENITQQYLSVIRNLLNEEG